MSAARHAPGPPHAPEVVPARREDRAPRNQTHQLRAGGPEAALTGAFLTRVERRVNRSDVDIHQIHRDLGASVLGDVPAHTADRLEHAGLVDLFSPGPGHRAAVLPDVERDPVCPPFVGDVEVDVVGDEELAGAGHHGPEPGHELRRAVVGCEVRILELAGQGLILALADGREGLPFGSGRSELIEVDRQGKFLADSLAEATGQIDAVVHGDVGHRNEGADVDRAHSGVGALVAPHVDRLPRCRHQLERTLEHGLRFTDEGDHRAVGFDAGVDIEQLDSRHRSGRLRNRVVDLRISAVGDVRYALHDLHLDPPNLGILCRRLAFDKCPIIFHSGRGAAPAAKNEPGKHNDSVERSMPNWW